MTTFLLTDASSAAAYYACVINSCQIWIQIICQIIHKWFTLSNCCVSNDLLIVSRKSSASRDGTCIKMISKDCYDLKIHLARSNKSHFRPFLFLLNCIWIDVNNQSLSENFLLFYWKQNYILLDHTKYVRGVKLSHHNRLKTAYK